MLYWVSSLYAPFPVISFPLNPQQITAHQWALFHLRSLIREIHDSELDKPLRKWMSWMYHKAISAHKKCFLLEFLIGFINVKQWIILLAPRMNFSNGGFCPDLTELWDEDSKHGSLPHLVLAVPACECSNSSNTGSLNSVYGSANTAIPTCCFYTIWNPFNLCEFFFA